MQEDKKINSYKDLIVWQKAFELAKNVYKTTSNLPKEEVYGLQLQIRRSSVSIVSNIAEGVNRKTRKDYAHFLQMSFGSVSELETQMLLCRDLYGINIITDLDLLMEVSKMLRSLIKKLETNN